MTRRGACGLERGSHKQESQYGNRTTDSGGADGEPGEATRAGGCADQGPMGGSWRYFDACVDDRNGQVRPTDNGTIDWVRELSPTWKWIDRDPLAQTELFLRAVCAPNDILHVFRKDAPSAGVLGVNLRSAEDWVRDVAHASAWGDLIVPNPFSGWEGETSGGKKSVIAQSCLASYPYLVLEMDDMPLPMQYAFWRNFILTSKLSDALVSVVHSGNRSLHGLIYVGCRTLLEWHAVRNSIRELFASDDDPMYRADAQAMCPRTATRLPGVKRGDKGILQELVYINPNVRENNMCFRGQCHGSSLRL